MHLFCCSLSFFISLHAGNVNSLSVLIDLESELSSLKIGYSLNEMRPNAPVATWMYYEPNGHLAETYKRPPFSNTTSLHAHCAQPICKCILCGILQVKLNFKVLLLVENILFTLEMKRGCLNPLQTFLPQQIHTATHFPHRLLNTIMGVKSG